MSDWISVKERMPENWVGVLVTNGTVVTAAEWSEFKHWVPHEGGGYEFEWDFDTNGITHWMPLPAPPEA